MLYSKGLASFSFLSSWFSAEIAEGHFHSCGSQFVLLEHLDIVLEKGQDLYWLTVTIWIYSHPCLSEHYITAISTDEIKRVLKNIFFLL